MKWPQRIIEQLGREPQVGDWFAECCLSDLFQFETEEDVLGTLELYDDMDTGGSFFKTKAEALTALRPCHERGADEVSARHE